MTSFLVKRRREKHQEIARAHLSQAQVFPWSPGSTLGALLGAPCIREALTIEEYAEAQFVVTPDDRFARGLQLRSRKSTLPHEVAVQNSGEDRVSGHVPGSVRETG